MHDRLKATFGSQSPKLGLERVPDSTRWAGRKEKLAVNKPNTRYYQGPNLGKPHELNQAQKSLETLTMILFGINYNRSIGLMPILKLD